MAVRKNIKPATRPIGPVELGPGRVRYAAGMRAGRWVFATGHKGTDYKNGMAANVLRERAPRHHKPKHKRETERIYRNISAVMRAGGTTMRNVVRVDQYYSTHRAVDPYHEVRRGVFRGRIPPSTSILQKGFLLTGQEIEVQAIGVVPSGDFRPRHRRTETLNVHPSSGYSPALQCGDFIFAAGMTAETRDIEDGPIDREARMPAGHLWKGTPIKLEAEFIIRRKLEPTLEAAGASLADVVKAQIYMRDVDDFAAFNEVWARHFPDGPPATTLITTATPGFIVADERIEINTISLATGGATRKKIIRTDVAMPWAGHSVAVRAGDLLFISGLMAVDKAGVVPAAERDPRQPHFGSSIEAQMDCILTNAERICRAAGASLANVVRIQQFHTDLSEFYPACQAWQKHLPGHYLPFSAIEIPGPQAVPGCSVLLDLWVYAP